MLAEFVQIVGLLAAFSSERNAAESGEAAEFFTWLTDHDHSELRALIEQNQLTSASIKALLNQGFKDLQSRLDDISGTLATFSSQSFPISQLAQLFAQKALSAQALELLSIMENNHAEFVLHQSALIGGDFLIFVPGPTHVPTEQRFLQDDLEFLVSLKLLRPGRNAKGEPLYYATRLGSELVSGKQ